MSNRYADMLFSIRVLGSPVGRGKHKLTIQRWMEGIRSTAKSRMDDKDYPVKDPVKIVCRFKVLPNARKYDLDNLVKCAIDALGAAGLFSPSSSGGHPSPWNTDDWLVHVIQAEKEAAEDPATEIEVWR